jgi:hypothetical protein
VEGDRKRKVEHARSGIARVDDEAAREAVIEPGGEIIKVEGEELNERRTPNAY